MRKLTAFLAIVGCFYAPCRFGLIILDDDDSARVQTQLSRWSDAGGALGSQYKKIVEPGKFLRRPFYSADKHFVLTPDRKPGPRVWARLAVSYSNPLVTAKPFFSYLRAPPLPL